MYILRYPTTNGAWAGSVFGQSTVFSVDGKEITLSVLFESPSQEPFDLRGLEKAWEASTNAAFINRSLPGEELIEKILAAINTTIKESSITLQGAVLLTEGLAVHFSTIGETEVILSSKTSTDRVSTVQQTESFTTVTSGEVEMGDLLILCPSFLAPDLRKVSTLSAEKLEKICLEAKTLLLAAYSHNPKTSNGAEETARDIAATARETLAKFLGKIAVGVSALKNIRLPRLPMPPKRATKITPRLIWSSRLLTIIVILALIGGVYFGARLSLNRLKIARQENQTPQTLLTLLQQTPPQDTISFLKSKFEFSKYQSLTDSEKTTFQEILKQRSIEPLNVTVQQVLPEKIIDVSALGEFLYLLDSSGQLWRYDTILRKIEQSGLIIEPQRVLAIKEDRILVTDKAGNIWLYDGTENQPISLPLPQSLSSGTKLIAKFSNNIYIYDSQTKKIWRISGFDRDIVNPTTYANTEALGLGLLRDLWITGDAVALDNTGKIKTFSRNVAGKELTVVISETDRLISNANAIVHLSGPVLTTYSPELKVVRTHLILAPDTPEVAVLQNDAIRFIGANKTLYRIGN